MNRISGTTSTSINPFYTACSTCPAGTGVDIATNNSIWLLNSSDALITSTGTSSYSLNARIQYADLTITFSRPVDNPVVHFTGLGGFYTYNTTIPATNGVTTNYIVGFTTDVDLITPGLTWTKLSGNPVMNVTSTQIANTASLFGAATLGSTTLNRTRTAASGSVVVNGLGITSFTVRFYLRGDGGLIQDGDATNTTLATGRNGNVVQWSSQAGHTPLGQSTNVLNAFQGDAFLIGLSLLPPPTASVVVGTPVCNTATNQYTATGTVSLTNAQAGSLTITDNGSTAAVVSVTTGQTSATFSVSGVSNASSHTVLAMLSSVTANTTYTAPASCTVCIPPSVTAQAASNNICTGQNATVFANVSPAGSYTYSWAAPAGVVLTGGSSATASASGLAMGANTFTVTVSSSPTCQTTATVSVTLSPAPAFTATSATACASTPLSFSSFVQMGNNTTYSVHASLADAQNDVNRLNPQQSFSISAATVYYVRGRELTSNCTGIQSLTLTPINCTNNPGTINLQFATVLNCTTNSYSATIQARSADLPSLSIGTSSILFMYNTASLSFVNYQALNFNSSGGWDAQISDGGSPGIVNITLTLSQTANSTQLINNAGWTNIGTITFTLANPGSVTANPQLVFDVANTNFNSLPANDGTNPIQNGTFTGVSAPGSLSCSVCSLTAAPQLTASSVTLCEASSATLTVSCSTGTPRWNTGATTATIIVQPATTTVYTAVCQSGSACQTPPASVTITVFPRPTVGPSQTLVCVNGAVPTSTTLTAQTNSSVLTGQWYAQPGNPTATTFANANSLNTTVSGLLPGRTYQFVWANGPTGCADGLTITTGTCTTVPLGSIGDFAWKDLNGNGIQDDGANSGISDVPVNLLKETSPGQFSVVATTKTSASGLYSFTGLTAGNYKVHFEVEAVPFYCQPTTQTVVTPNDATNSKINPQGDTPVIVIDPTNPNLKDYPKADAGFKPVPLGSLGDYVWKDTNNDGIQNDGNTGASNIGLKLLNSDGVYVIRGVLSGSQEVPSVPTSGTGLIYGTFNPANNTLMLVTGFSNLSGTVSMAHIHTGVAGVNGPVAVDLVPAGFPTGVRTGNAVTNTVLTAAQKDLLMSNRLYVNIHTSTNGGGEVRAQLMACEFTNSSGNYLFTNLPTDTYTVAVDTKTIPATCVISSKQNSTSATEATDSDFNPTTGMSDAVAVVPDNQATRDIRTVDLALVASVTGTPALSLVKKVSNTRAKIGDVLTYTLLVSNTGNGAATGVVVSDTYTSALTFVAGSTNASTGTFIPSSVGGTWSIASLPAGATATLTYSLSVVREGVLRNAASLGTEVVVNTCTTAPILVCPGQPFAFKLTAPTGHNRYQWYRTTTAGVVLVSDVTATSANAATANSYTATQVGEYQVVLNEGVSGSCVDGSCCPIIIEEKVIIPPGIATQTASCSSVTALTPNADARIILSTTALSGQTYNIAKGSSFTASAPLFTSAQTLPTQIGATLATGLANPATVTGDTYTVRIYQGDCFVDVVVTLQQTNCACSEVKCVPISIRRTR